MTWRDVTGGQISEGALVAPVSKNEQSIWATRMIDRCFASDAMCSAQVRLVEQLLRVLLNADPKTALSVSQALADASRLASAVSREAPTLPFRTMAVQYEDTRLLATELATEFRSHGRLLGQALERYRIPSVVSANLLIPAIFFDAVTVGHDEILRHIAGARVDRQHAIAVCALMGSKAADPDVVEQIRLACTRDIETWTKGCAAVALVAWGSDQDAFDEWDQALVSRLWKEAASPIGGLIAIDSLPPKRRVLVLERLLEWGIADPENPLDLAVRLLIVRFAPNLIILSWTDTFREGLRMFVFGPHPGLPIKGPLDADQSRSLALISQSPMLYRQRTNLWALFGLPESGEKLREFRGEGK